MKKHYLSLDEIKESKMHEKRRFENLLSSFILLCFIFFMVYFMISKIF